MTPDLRQLQALLAVATHGTLGRAADALHCSATAVSMQLTGLQHRLGVTLLRRTGRGLALTPEGEQLLPMARDAVEAVARLSALAAGQQAGQTARSAGSPTVPVVLGTILDPAALRLGEFLHAVRQQGPQLHPELRHGVSGWVQREVREGQLHAGFCLGQPDVTRLRVQRLATVRYVVVAPRGWQSRLHGRGWDALAELPWIDTPRDSVHHQLLQPVFKAAGTRRHTVARVDQEASMMDLVKAGFGLSLAREAVALREADQAGVAISRQHALDTALNLVARPVSAMPTDQAEAGEAVNVLFDVAATVWQPGTLPGKAARALSVPGETPAPGTA